MFARKATFWAIDRARSIAPVAPVHSNDNHLHRMARVPHAPPLVCHWRAIAELRFCRRHAGFDARSALTAPAPSGLARHAWP